jgi:thiol-disulfide isomerase/thioredoxin
MKKIFLFLMFIAVLAIIALFVIILQKSPEVILVDGETIPALTCRNIPDVVILYRRGCPACGVTIPRLQELEQELDMEFKYYDFAIAEDTQEVKELGLIVQFVPTVIIKCKVYIGVRTKEQYKEYIIN